MFRSTQVRTTIALAAGAAALVAGPTLASTLGAGGTQSAGLPESWEASQQWHATNAAASNQNVLENKAAEEKARKKAAKEKAAKEKARKEAAAKAAAARKAEAARKAKAAQTSRSRASGGTPAQNRALGMAMCADRGWSASQCADLGKLWQKESGWSTQAHNPSGAHGIPQALPGSKMSSAGPNWQSNPRTQIAWGLNYIASRYGNPSNAWYHSQSHGWY